MVGQWSWMPKLCILISVHKICIADGLPDPYRDPRTQNLPPKAHQCPYRCGASSLRHYTWGLLQQWAVRAYCRDICIAASRDPQFSGSGLFLDCVRMLPRSWISSPPDGRTSVTVSRATAVGPPIRHRRRLERKSRSRRSERPDPAHSSQNHNGVATCRSTIQHFFLQIISSQSL